MFVIPIIVILGQYALLGVLRYSCLGKTIGRAFGDVLTIREGRMAMDSELARMCVCL